MVRDVRNNGVDGVRPRRSQRISFGQHQPLLLDFFGKGRPQMVHRHGIDFDGMNHGSGAEQVFREGSRSRSNFQHRAALQVARHGGDGIEVCLIDEEVLAEAPVVWLPGLKAGDEVDGASHAFTGRSISTSRGWRFRSRSPLRSDVRARQHRRDHRHRRGFRRTQIHRLRVVPRPFLRPSSGPRR